MKIEYIIMYSKRWPASGDNRATQIVERVLPGRTLEFVWSNRRCTVARDWTTGAYRTLKDLRKLKRKGYPLEAIVAVDDTPAKHARNYGNLVAVSAIRSLRCWPRTSGRSPRFQTCG